MPNAAPSFSVTDDHRRAYDQQGVVTFESVIPEDTLRMLREECSYFLGYADAEMDAQGLQSAGLNRRGNRYFVGLRYRFSHRLYRFLFGDLMARIAGGLLGDEVYLFYEQWVVKGPEQGMSFAWHQDSAYVAGPMAKTHRPYLTCWCVLDHVDERNGTAYILPHDRGDTRGRLLPHTKMQGRNDLVGYHGDDPGDPAVVPAGSIVCFSSYTLHRSGANTSDHMRRVYLPQYSAEPILNDDGRPQNLAVPFLRDRNSIYDPDKDTAARYGGLDQPV